MSTFNSEDHPRNHPTGASRFSDKVHSPVEAELKERSYDHRAGEPLPELPRGSRIDIDGTGLVRVLMSGETGDWVDKNGKPSKVPLDTYDFTVVPVPYGDAPWIGWADEIRQDDTIRDAHGYYRHVQSIIPTHMLETDECGVSVVYDDFTSAVFTAGWPIKISRPPEGATIPA